MGVRGGEEGEVTWGRGRPLTPLVPLERRGRRKAAAEEVDHLLEGPATLRPAGAAALQHHPSRCPAGRQFLHRSLCLRCLHLSVVSSQAGTWRLEAGLRVSTLVALARQGG